MHLLKLEDDGKFSLRDYIGKDIPRYAILSHTWGKEHDEVTFQDLTDGLGKSKAGYEKLVFCAKQAMVDGLEFFWVDTCCINKLSSALLSEAIRSMFRWYQNSAKCYVYLSDVTTSGFANNDQSFQQSRWFTRGWTLQELLAPTCVEFFSKESDRLGDKGSLITQIARITDISVRALRGSPLNSFSVEERMSWAGKRVTKREEDMAYSLLGILDISMSLRYGDGKKEWERLKKKISKASTSERTLVFPVPATNVADMELEEELEGNDAGEVSWMNIMKGREENDRCFNCGSGKHWEDDCSQNCGRCLYPKHTASWCGHPVRCMKCKQQGHMFKDCPY